MIEHRRKYQAVHIWLRRNFPKRFCENCLTQSNLEFSLIHGKELDHNRDNFKVLCIKCHRKYDGPSAVEGWKKRRNHPNPWAVGERANNKLNELQARIIRRSLKNEIPGIYLARIFKVQPPAISRIRSGKRWNHLFESIGQEVL